MVTNIFFLIVRADIAYFSNFVIYKYVVQRRKKERYAMQTREIIFAARLCRLVELTNASSRSHFGQMMVRVASRRDDICTFYSVDELTEATTDGFAVFFKRSLHRCTCGNPWIGPCWTKLRDFFKNWFYILLKILLKKICILKKIRLYIIF